MARGRDLCPYARFLFRDSLFPIPKSLFPARRPTPYMLAMTASANRLVLNSVAPSIRRAKS